MTLNMFTENGHVFEKRADGECLTYEWQSSSTIGN